MRKLMTLNEWVKSKSDDDLKEAYLNAYDALYHSKDCDKEQIDEIGALSKELNQRGCVILFAEPQIVKVENNPC
jgi:thymidylate synthase